MADEPRRSGRPGKGVHTKNQEVEAEAESQTPQPTKSKTGKNRKGRKVEEEVEDDEVIRCVCDHYEEMDGVSMVACESCGAWQHNACVGLPLELPEEFDYFCERCKPDQHEELLESLARREQPWLASSGKKPWKGGNGWLRTDWGGQGPPKKGKAGRQSGGRQPGGRPSVGSKEATPAKEKTETPTPAPPAVTPGAQERSKRRQSHDVDMDSQQPSKLRKPSAQDTPASSSRKSSGPAKKAGRAVEVKDEPATSIDDLKASKQDSRHRCAKYLKGKFEPQIKSLSLASEPKFRIPDEHNPSTLSESIALSVEHQLFLAYCNVPKPDWEGPYTSQMRTIAANAPQNSDLMLRILNSEISAKDLAKMSSDAMASQEKQKEAAKIKEQAEKQSTLVQGDSRPNIRRTHKGEEYVEDPNAGSAATESLPPPPPMRRESDYLPPHSPTSGQQDTTMTEDGPPHSASLERRSSSKFDINKVWESQSMPEKQPPTPSYNSHSTYQQEQPVEPKAEADPTVDRLLEEDEDESAPYSPGDYDESRSSAWTGHVDMPNIGKFRASARHVAGADLSKQMPIGDIFPDSLTMSGRIHDQKADDYLSGLGSARATDVVAFNITPTDASEGSESRRQFDKLWKYFIDRERWGVVNDAVHRTHVNDTYIIPLRQGTAAIPTFLNRLHFNIIETPRPKDMLLAVFVIKWKTQQQPSQGPPMSAQASAMSPSGSMPVQPFAQTPTAPGANMMSPVSAQQGQGFPQPSLGQLPLHQQQQPPAFPSNLYNGGAPPMQNGQSQAQAQAILGEYYSCPTAQKLVNSQDAIPEPLLINLRNVFESHPAARTDMAEFERLLTAQQQGGS